MFLTLTSTAPDATDLGYLLHKHPDRAQSFELPVGTAHVFYPEATPERCTVALLLEVDPIGLVRNRRFGGGDAFALAQYVNDRPYAASSMVAVALGRVFSTAMKGTCAVRPELEGVPLPLTIRVPALPARGGVDLAERLFAPLGWVVQATTIPLDPDVPRWGDSRYVDLTLTGTLLLSEALSHLYVLLPVLDGAKHYWVAADEIDKLVRSGGAWLPDHPERDLVTRRYLAHRRRYVEDASARLDALDDKPDQVDIDALADESATEAAKATEATEATGATGVTGVVTPTARLADVRRDVVVEVLKEVGSHRVVDLGCGEGALLRELLRHSTFSEVVGADVSATALARAEDRLGLDRLPDRQRARLTLRQTSVTYRDEALTGYDAIVLMEVVEHLDPDRLPALERSVFGGARPEAVVVTTPNAEYNARYESLTAGAMRHPDHRFEWTRAEFVAWAGAVARAHGYAVQFRPVGDVHPELGPPTQLAVFVKDQRPLGDSADGVAS